MDSDIKWSVHSARRCTKLIRVNFPAFTLFLHIYLRIMQTTTNISANNSNSNLWLPTVLTTSTRDKIPIKEEGITLTRPIRNQTIHLYILQDIQRLLIVFDIQIRKLSISARQTRPSSVHVACLLTRVMVTSFRSAGWTTTGWDRILQM